MPHSAKWEVVKRYRAALRKYIEANASLEGLIGPEFAEAYERAEEARAEFEKVRQQLLDSNAKAKAEGA
jgi:hypothetical protein